MAKRDPHALYCDDPSLTQQNFAEECDINKIVKRAQAGSDIGHVNSMPAMYGDFSNIPDYQQAFDIVQRANKLFMTMPWDVRERFRNDPQKMVEFLQDANNREEAIKLGLVVPPKADEALETLKSIDSSLKGKKSVGGQGSGAKRSDTGTQDE